MRYSIFFFLIVFIREEILYLLFHPQMSVTVWAELNGSPTRMAEIQDLNLHAASLAAHKQEGGAGTQTQHSCLGNGCSRKHLSLCAKYQPQGDLFVILANTSSECFELILSNFFLA